ncbi:kanosamine-6-phosphate phosphatase [Marinithermofilum abyssi]|uniref:Kanosamine-6-phosphate phosphatase n=1 Tax=Marinithermofilum abyssi TaxID=1571185 RepID=A0A8J2YCI4_9BACL|nr:HAD-IIB family hydrolase [Marinithermofilum abyssi]GGE16230.1 kanosamine-6-phosphate phosphatase [Marinithermofilum abyssi]
MLLSKKAKFKSFSNITSPRHIVFCDFDETYYPHSMNGDRQHYLHELEDYIEKKANNGELMIGWVTGSSVKSVLDKMERGNFRFFPHFIASDLGTEITYFTEDHFGKRDSGWDSRLKNGNFSKGKSDEIIQLLQEKYQIYLRAQTQLGSSRYKRNYYYQEQNESVDEKNFLAIKTVAQQYGVAVNINRCNPLAGDPEDCFDVDFIPTGTGKDEIVRFMLNKYKVKPENAFAFGDSGNDLRMLKVVKHGYLVENATEEAKNAHAKIATGEYSIGIINTLKSIIDNCLI